MGAFREPAEADRLKAGLALLGIVARIEKVTIEDKHTFRVRSGPYRDRRQTDEIHAMLQKNNIKSIVIELEK